MAVQLILWDWNGTLLDDMEISVEGLNLLLAQHGYPQRYSYQEYREIFGFPIEDYYRRAGFDFSRHPYPLLAQRYMEHDIPASASCGLQPGARQILAQLQAAGLRQVILSASPLPTLRAQVEALGVGGFFEELLGLGDIYAKSKVELGLAWLRRAGVQPGSAVMVGDSLHDAEVARALGAGCVLCSAGHQAPAALQAAGVPVLAHLGELAAFLGL